VIDLPELLALIQAHWPDRWERGRILHVHRNGLKLANGSYVHLRILVQQIPTPSSEDDTMRDYV
jgi:hypothetical protein